MARHFGRCCPSGTWHAPIFRKVTKTKTGRQRLHTARVFLVNLASTGKTLLEGGWRNNSVVLQKHLFFTVSDTRSRCYRHSHLEKPVVVLEESLGQRGEFVGIERPAPSGFTHSNDVAREKTLAGVIGAVYAGPLCHDQTLSVYIRPS